jgi:hypothetical protein
MVTGQPGEQVVVGRWGARRRAIGRVVGRYGWVVVAVGAAVAIVSLVPPR